MPAAHHGDPLGSALFRPSGKTAAPLPCALQRIMEIRGQIAKEWIEELKQVGSVLGSSVHLMLVKLAIGWVASVTRPPKRLKQVGCPYALHVLICA